VTLEAEPVSPGEALSGKLSGKLFHPISKMNSKVNTLVKGKTVKQQKTPLISYNWPCTVNSIYITDYRATDYGCKSQA